ncbi:rho family-interacting cell polarization regulator 2-like isoform X2 [Glandiceps talaboti]
MESYSWQHRPRSSTFAGFKRKYMPSSSSPKSKPLGSPLLSRRSNNKVRRMFSFNRAQRLPKVPRPARTGIIFDCLKQGLREYIDARQTELDEMKSQQHGTLKSVRSRTGFHYDLDKHIKNTERFIRKLDFHLSKIDELQDNYNIQQRIREGAKNIMKAYEDSNSQNCRDHIQEAKTGFKDCTQAMCCMEAELETLLGYFHLEVKGIAGFARLCVGDVFEVALKHGSQKWKFKGRVEKDTDQTWENRTTLLYPLIADSISIRVTELKGLGRPNVVLGNMECDTTVLYKAEPQILTVHINDAGTLKLNLKVAWSPFQAEEEMGSSGGTVNKSSFRSHNKDRTGIDNILNKTGRSDESSSSRMDDMDSVGQSASRPTLNTALHTLDVMLQDYRGVYTQIDKLQEVLHKIEDLCVKISNGNHHESEAHMSVENALKSFDFLNTMEDESAGEHECCTKIEDVEDTDSQQITENTEEKLEDTVESMNDIDNKECVMETEDNKETTVDAGINTNCSNSPSIELSTGNEELDITFTQHLLHCQYLLSMLGSFGPLRSKEVIALGKLEIQTRLLARLLELNPSKSVASIQQVIPELKDKPGFTAFWMKCCLQPVILYVSVESVIVQFELQFGARLRTSHPTVADNVFQTLVKTMVDRSSVDMQHCNYYVTLYQFTEWCIASHKQDLEQYIAELVNELSINETLQPSNEDVLKDLKKLPKVPLPSSNLISLAMLLLEADPTTKTGVSIYMEMMATDNNWKKQAVNVFLECLEEKDQALRQAGCLALGSINASSCIEHLLYLCRCDVDDVKQCAKDTLLSFGEEGKLAYDQALASSQQMLESLAVCPGLSGTCQMTTEL